WPRLARLLADALPLPAFRHRARFEKATAQTPVAEQRQGLFGARGLRGGLLETRQMLEGRQGESVSQQARQALREAGAPLSATSHARERPVRGPMSR
ncbi:hypothetical protein ACV34T_32000, partial [Pseudomonas aeruginosa]